MATDPRWEKALDLAGMAIHESDGRGLIGGNRRWLRDRVARAIYNAHKDLPAQAESASETPADAALQAAKRRDEEKVRRMKELLTPNAVYPTEV